MPDNRYSKEDVQELLRRDDSPLFREQYVGHHGLPGDLFFHVLLEEWDIVLDYLVDKRVTGSCRDEMRRVLLEASIEDLPLYVGRSSPPPRRDFDTPPCGDPKPQVCNECMWLAAWRLKRGK